MMTSSIGVTCPMDAPILKFKLNSLSEDSRLVHSWISIDEEWVEALSNRLLAPPVHPQNTDVSWIQAHDPFHWRSLSSSKALPSFSRITTKTSRSDYIHSSEGAPAFHKDSALPRLSNRSQEASSQWNAKLLSFCLSWIETGAETTRASCTEV